MEVGTHLVSYMYRFVRTLRTGTRNVGTTKGPNSCPKVPPPRSSYKVRNITLVSMLVKYENSQYECPPSFGNEIMKSKEFKSFLATRS